MEAPKIEDSIEIWSASPPLAHLYRGEGEEFGIKVRFYWEHPWGTYWEPIGQGLLYLAGCCDENGR